MKNVATLFDWLVDGAPGAKTPMEVLAHLNPGLVAAGVAVARCEAFVRTLHPHIAGRSFLWRPGAAVDVIIVRAMRALMLIPVLLVVAATSCKPPAAEACGAFV